MLTITDGNANVGVGVMVGEGVMLGVNVNVKVGDGVIVAVAVGVKVGVLVGVWVHEAAVAVMDVAVIVACISGDGPQAVRTSNPRRVKKVFFIMS